MKCKTVGEDCTYKYVDPKAELTAIESELDTSHNTLKVTITGTSLATSTSQVELLIDGLPQIAISAD